jgi:hypothetical protein
MYLLMLIIGIVVGIILYRKVPIWIRKWFPKWDPELKVYEIQFKISWLSQPSLFTVEVNGELIKTKPITIRVKAQNEESALLQLHELIIQEIKPDLLTIKEVND